MDLGKQLESRDKHRELLIKQLGIFELRALGREVGVKSPTSKKRDELIELILDQIYNPSHETFVPVRRGRPHKQLSNIDDIMQHVIGADDTISQIKPLRYDEVVCFSQDVPVRGNVPARKEVFSGVVRRSQSVHFFVDMKNCTKVFMPEEMVEQYNLQSGDFVVALASQINSENQFIAEAIQEINFVSSDEYVAPTQQQGQPIISQESLPYGSFKLFEGRRNLILYKNNLFEDDRFSDFAKLCQERGYTLITLGLNTCFEDQILFSSMKDMLNFTTAYASDFNEGFNKIVDSIALTERMLESGKKCILFISDIIEVLSVLDQCFTDSEMISGHKKRSVIVAQKLIGLGRALDNGASVTIIMTYRDADKEDNFLSNEIAKICSRFGE